MKHDSLFAYGTLRHPDIITYVIGRIPESEEVKLKDFVRYRIKGADFPGIFPREGEQVDGTLFTGISSDELLQLDDYESDLYVRQKVEVIHLDGSLSLAYAYILPPENESVCTEEPWDLTSYYLPNDG